MQPSIGPSWTLTLTAAVVIAGCAALVSLSFSCLAIAWDPCALIGGFLLLPIPVFLGVEQYRGTFRKSRAAARNAAWILLATGTALVFVSLVGMIVAVGGPSGLRAGLCVSGASLAGAFACLSASRGNSAWSKRLPPRGPSAWQFSLRELLGLAAVVALVAGLTTHFVRTTGPQYAEHVSPREAPFYVPPGASDVCYCRGPRGSIAYEFTIDEQGFRTWVLVGLAGLESTDHERRIQPVDNPTRVIRYAHFCGRLSAQPSATVSHGCYWQNGDGWKYAVFDRNAQRAYYFASFH